MIISMIVAIGKNNVIGVKNKLPWQMPADMKRFVKVTTGKPVIMGRKTYESIGRPLPHRTNIILTRSDYHADGCIITHSVEEAVEEAKKIIEKTNNEKEIMIIGGASIYEQFLPLAKRMYITYIDAEVGGDVFFPDFDKTEWKQTFREEHQKDGKNLYDYTFVTLERT